LRDLSNAVERAVILVEDGGAVEARHVAMVVSDELTTGSLKAAVGEFERAYVLRVLADNKDNRTHTARALGISRQALIEKLRRYGLVEPQGGEE
jgi:transcriptional regulator with PAS, ATPase and Fis domain